jgi:degradative hydroxymethylglutaryl-CoA reductase
MASSLWAGFYTKSLQERKNQLEITFPHLKLGELEEGQADNMIENCIGIGSMPLGLAPNFKVNGKSVVIPMVIEEPSVIAAVSGAGKLISQFGGFSCQAPERNIMYAQIQLLDIPDENIDVSIELLKSKRTELIIQGNECCQSMHNRGGGVVDVKFRKLKRSNCQKFTYWLIVHFLIDTCDAMGANCCSSVAEGMAPILSSLTKGRVGLRIVSNLSEERVSKAQFKLPLDKLGYKGYSGRQVAERIVEAYEWACDDHFRAVTHNKGIMNGIDAVSIATGQDWRAIEAAAHGWASLDGYKPMTKYQIETLDDKEYLIGCISLPIMVGTKGGVLKTNPLYQYSLGLMGSPDAKTLGMVLFFH